MAASARPVSGQRMPVGDLPGWRQVFADDFSNETVPLGSFSGCRHSRHKRCSGLRNYPTAYRNWWAYPDRWSDSRYGTYFPSRVLSIKGGALDYHIHTQTVRGVTYHMVAAPVPRVPSLVRGHGILYGRFVLRARFDSLPGYHVAFLLWPNNGIWPRDGEIDFPETDLDHSSVSAFVHWGSRAHPRFDYFSSHARLTRWHTYAIDWLPTGVSFYLDGRLLGVSREHVPRTPMHWVLQADTFTGQPAPSDGTAGDIQIAWITAYKPTKIAR
jgi:hypothetical protein